VLINVASVIGKIRAPLYASYTAAKFGVVGLCDSLRQELAVSGPYLDDRRKREGLTTVREPTK
jgi:short-subunit dehydrogenase